MSSNEKKIGKGGKSIFDTPKFQGYVDQLADLVCKGWKHFELYAEIISQEPDLKDSAFNKLLMRAYAKVRNKLHRDREYIFQLHLQRYEELYKRAMDMTDKSMIELDERKHVGPILSKIGDAMKTLKYKEELVGLHDKSLVLEVTTDETTVVQSNIDAYKGSGYDLSKLSLQEKVELLQLLNEARVTPVEGIRQTMIKKVTVTTVSSGESETNDKPIDIAYEEMPEKVIDKLQQTSDDEKEMYIESLIIEDLVDRTVKTKSLEELHESIDESLKAKFEKAMRRRK